MLIRYISLMLNGEATFADVLIALLLIVPIVLISLTVHEYMHGLVSYKFGDPTAMNYGRLTLNPIKHIDPFGAVCMLFFGFGWARPVPINSGYYKNTRLGISMVSLAGPLSNFLMAFVATPIMLLIGHISIETEFGNAPVWLVYTLRDIGLWSHVPSFGGKMALSLLMFFLYFVQINIMFGIFNLLPIPPLDGSRILLVFLPQKAYYFVVKYELYIKLALMAILFTGLLDEPLNFLENGVFKVFLDLWDLIPGLGWKWNIT